MLSCSQVQVYMLWTRDQKRNKESKSCSPNNDSAASTEQIMTLHPQEMKGFSFEECLTDDDDQSNMGSKTHKHTKSRLSTSSSKSSIKSKHSSKSSSSAASSSVISLKMKKIQLEVQLKSQREINDLERKHAEKRYTEEQKLLKKQQEKPQKILQTALGSRNSRTKMSNRNGRCKTTSRIERNHCNNQRR